MQGSARAGSLHAALPSCLPPGYSALMMTFFSRNNTRKNRKSLEVVDGGKKGWTEFPKG
jgi:hypothetical protein